jgi:hypothetical protein
VIRTVWDFATEPFEGEPSAQQRSVDLLFDQTEDAGLWVDPPLTFPKSKAYIVNHYARFHPLRTHSFQVTPNLVPLDIVVTDAPAVAGLFITTFGRVLQRNLISPHTRVADTLLQVVSPTVKQPTPREIDKIVDCRVPLRPFHAIRPGQAVFVQGVVIAAGQIQFTDGGFRPGAYMACSAVVRPKGKCGRGPVAPVPGTGSSCPPYPHRTRREAAGQLQG